MTMKTPDRPSTPSLLQARVAMAVWALIGLVFLAVGAYAWGLVALVIAGGLGIAWSRRRARAPTHRAESLIEDLPEEPIDWVDKLAMRGARLRRFVELNAPEVLIDEERRLVREAIARVDPAVAFSVLRAVGAQGGELDEYD